MAHGVEESEKLEMYVEYRGEKPVRYAYGEPWVAMAMYMNDYGFPTPEEAIEAWNRRNGE